MSAEPDPAVRFDPLFYYKLVATETGVLVPEDAKEINPPALHQLLREALPIGQRGDPYLEYPFGLAVEASSVAVGDYLTHFSNAESYLSMDEGGRVTEIGVSVTLGGLDIKPDWEGSPFVNPRAVYDQNTGSFDLDTVIINYLLAAGIRRQAGRLKTGFSQPHDTKDMHNFARQRTNRMIAGQVEPVIRLRS